MKTIASGLIEAGNAAHTVNPLRRATGTALTSQVQRFVMPKMACFPTGRVLGSFPFSCQRA